MAWHLFRLGNWSFRRRKTVAVLWIAILVGVVMASGSLGGKTSDEFKISGLESAEAFDLIKERSPQAAPDGASARLVFEAPAGEDLTDPSNQRAVAAALAKLETGHVTSVTDPFTDGTVSDSGRVAYATATFSVSSIDLDAADERALEAARAAAADAGLGVAVGGNAAPSDAHPPIGELVGVAVAFLVLLLTLGSLVAAGMPLLTALIGVGVGIFSITLTAGFVELNSATPALGLMLGLAVGIDYALFIMTRYQHEVRRGRPLQEAAGIAVGTAGSAVVFAGLTVVIALAGLSVAGVTFLTQMGLAAAGMVGVAVLIALTLIPALLGFARHRVVKGHLPETADPTAQRGSPTLGLRWVQFVDRHKAPLLGLGVAVAVIMFLPVMSMQLALPDDSTEPAGSDARVAHDLITDNFGAGANGPLIVVVDTKNAADPVAAVTAVEADLRSIEDEVAEIVSPLTDDSAAARKGLQQQLAAVGFATITVVPNSGPADQATKDLVATIRDQVSDLPQQTGARALVSGQTAVGVDVTNKLNDVFPRYLAVVVGLAFLLLMLVFRSVLVPLKATAGFLLSLGISLGATVAVFQWGWLSGLLGLDATSPVIFLLPIVLTGVLFGLAMDYEVFLVSRMREAFVHGTPARKAVIIGFQHSARVVAAAAVIMVAVFAGFAYTDDFLLKTIGFALAIGVLADAFLVRMLIVPAVMAIAGSRIWWIPAWLDRTMPNLDIEGEALTRRLTDLQSPGATEASDPRVTTAP